MLITELYKRPRIKRPEINSTVDPVAAFKLRCEVRAHLYGEGELHLHDAVDELEAFARSLSINHKIGIDGSQAIMAEAFRPVREREWAAEITQTAVVTVPDHTPASTIEALLYSLRSGLSCLQDRRNRARLMACNEDAVRTIAERLLNMKVLSKGARENWPASDVAKLLSIWAAERKA